MSAASYARVDPIHRDDVFVSRLAPCQEPTPVALIDLFLAHRRGKPWNEIAHCTSCKRKVITVLAAQAGGKCGYCRLGLVVQIWDAIRAHASLTTTLNKADQDSLYVALGHTQSPQPVLIGFLQMSTVPFARLVEHLGHDVLIEVGNLMGRHDSYAVIDNLVVADSTNDDVTALKLLDAVIKQFTGTLVRVPLLTLVENSSLYEGCLAQRNFRLCKKLPDRVLLMGRLS